MRSLLLGTVTLMIHAAQVVALAPLLAGLVRGIQARLTGHAGAPLLQPWRDLRRLAGKQPVIAENASPLFRAAPFASFVAVATVAALVPSFALGMATAPLADLLVIAGLLTLARCAEALAAMDTPFGGIGASRTLTYAGLAEPGLMVVILSLGLLSGTTNLDAIAGLLRDGRIALHGALAPAFFATAAVAVAQTGCAPLDKRPSSELAMTEAMRLEYSGRDLALLEGAAALRLMLWLNLIAAVFLPFGTAMPGAGPLQWAVGLGAWAGKILVLSAALAVLGAMSASVRPSRVPQLLGIAVLLGLLATMLLVASAASA
ncbi:MAG: respiratory chain complex I subunit 1 family protein [Geminicoccaceae bacterium]